MASKEQMKEHAIKVIEEIWNNGNLALIDELIADTVVLHDPQNPTQITNKEGYRQYTAGLRAACPDFHISIEDMVAEEDRIAVRITSKGTQRGDLPGLPATGKQFAIEGIFIRHLQAGKSAEEWMTLDYLGMLQQLGVIPAPE